MNLVPCPRCRTPIEGAARFCPACGLPLASSSPGAPPTLAVAPGYPPGSVPPVPAASEENLGAWGWFIRKTVPFAVFTACFGVLFGYLRARHTGFLAGLQGMGAGMLIGYLCTRIGPRPYAAWTFGRRIRLALGSALVFAVAQVVFVSILNAGPGDNSLEWLTDVLDGYQAEPFFSVGKTGAMVQATTGALEELGWVLFEALDILLFAFAHLGGTAMGPIQLPTDRSDPPGEES